MSFSSDSAVSGLVFGAAAGVGVGAALAYMFLPPRASPCGESKSKCVQQLTTNLDTVCAVKEPIANEAFATKASRYYPMPYGSSLGMSPAIVPSSTFLLQSVEAGAEMTGAADSPNPHPAGYLYTRWGNPTTHVAAQAICAIEGAKGAVLFASGMCAIASTFMCLLKQGDHIIAPNAVYGGTYEFLTKYAPKFGIEVSFVDATDVENYRKAIKSNTKVLYAESPANPGMRLTDLYTLGQISKTAHTVLVVDGTFATPYHVRALDIPGVDISLHAATKYLGGHSDLTAGYTASNDEKLLVSLAHSKKIFGGMLSPFDSMLLARGIKTLDVRMERHAYNGLRIAEFLSKHPQVDRVNYPGLPTHPDHELARKMMKKGYGGMMSFEVKGGIEAGRLFVQNLKLINLAVSLGSVESLIVHCATTTHLMVPREQRVAAGVSDGLIRFSIGIEDVDDLIADLGQALSVVQAKFG